MRSLLNRGRTKRGSRGPESGGLRSTQLYRPSDTDKQDVSLAPGPYPFDEVLIADARACLRPAQLVERKLISLLNSVYLPMSHVRTTAVCNRRGPCHGG